MEPHDQVMIALRQIIRSIDLYSKQIKKEYGLTSPQLLLMRAIDEADKDISIRQLSINTNMSQATATSILDRLEASGLVVRERDKIDKRKVHALLTDNGKQILTMAPEVMQRDFISQFQSLDSWEQNLILSSLQRLSKMMNKQPTNVAKEDLFLFLDNSHHL